MYNSHIRSLYIVKLLLCYAWDRLETSLYQVLFNPREYTVFVLRERTERTERDICGCVSNTPHAVVVYYYHNGWLRD